MNLIIELNAKFIGLNPQSASATIPAVKENPFLWLYIPRGDASMTWKKLRNYVKTLFTDKKYAFPKEIPESFIDYLTYQGAVVFEIKVELHWRLIQVAGAIWENDGLSNVLRLLEKGDIPEWEKGKNALENLSVGQREDIKKNDAHKMCAVLLYDFACGSVSYGRTDFTQEDAFCRELNKDGLLLKEVIGKFYLDMTKEGMKNEEQYLEQCENIYHSSFSFSPDHTASIKESWEKHILAWNSNPVIFIIGGMRATIFKKDNKFIIRFTNEMGLKSLALHIMDNINVPGPLKTTIQTFTFTLSLDEFRKYK